MKLRDISKKLMSVIALFLIGGKAMAATASADQLIYGIDNYDVLVSVLLIGVLFLFIALMGVAFALYYVVNINLQNAIAEEEETEESGWAQWFWQKLNAAKPMKQEAALLMHHEYDGIRELDNDLPPWWKYLFYATIIFAVGYMGAYHWWTDAEQPVSVREYKAEVLAGEAVRNAYLEKMASLIDETNVELEEGESGLAEGEKIFMSNCQACHGKLGEGGAGPNLTDEYWLHGGGVKNIFKTIKYGIPTTAMISWEKKLTPQQIQYVSSYIVKMEGSNPPNAKAPQGEKWVGEEE